MMIRQMQILVGSMMASLALIAVVLVFVLPDSDAFTAPPLWLLAAQFALGGLVHVALESIGYRTLAIHPETDEATAADEAFGVFQSRTILRSSVAELVAMGSLAAAFIIDNGGIISYAIGAAISLALTAVHAWPWSRPIDKTIASLERDGGRSHLREKLGIPSKLGGAIQEF